MSPGFRWTLAAGSTRTRFGPSCTAHADSVALISVMWANNEVGTVQPVAELADIAHEYGVPLHTDAVQAIGAVPVDFADSGADAMTVTAHKLGGPYGVGALLLRRDAECVPLLHGGGQERDLRSGTLDPPGTTGFAVAASAAVVQSAAECPPPRRAADPLDQRNSGGRPGRHRQWTSRPNGLPGNRAPELPGLRGRFVAHAARRSRDRVFDRLRLLAGVARPSHVLIAMGADPISARGSLRFSLGHTSTEADVDAVIDAIGPVVERARRAG